APTLEPSAPAISPAPADTEPTPVQPPMSIVRMGEYVASPWVDQRGGPRVSGSLMGNADLPAVAGAGRERMNLYDPVLIKPPAGTTTADRQLYLTYRLGPLFEDMGQIVVPTGIIQITRPAQNGEAAVGRVVKLFN